jgi:hypothetical protein
MGTKQVINCDGCGEEVDALDRIVVAVIKDGQMVTLDYHHDHLPSSEDLLAEAERQLKQQAPVVAPPPEEEQPPE